MAFLAPYMLFGALAGGIPIALHFFYRSRYRTVPWAAMKFLLTSIEQTSRRLRFQELILLAMRVLLLILLAFALARLSSRAARGGAAEAVDAVFILDNSMSMTANDGDGSRLERAKAAALEVLDNLPPYSTVQVIAGSNRSRLLGPEAPSNLDHARFLIQELEPDDLASDLLPALQAAESALAKGNAANKELYLFSDLQKLGWDVQSSATVAKVKEIGEGATVYVVRCGNQPLRNASLVGAIPQSTIPHANGRCAVSALVRNSSPEPVRDLTVTLLVDSQEHDKSLIPAVGPGETKTVSLTAKLVRPGMSVITTQLSADDLLADNRLDQVVDVRELVRVLIVDGTPNEQDPEQAGGFFLFHAVRPVAEAFWDRYHVQPRLVEAGRVSPEALDDIQVCFFANVSLQPGSEGGVPSAAFLDRLVEFVHAGGGLVVFGGSNVSDGSRRQPAAYNRELFDERRLLPCRIAGDLRIPPERPIRFDPTTIEPAGFLAAFRNEPLNAIGQVELLQMLTLDAESLQAVAGKEPPRVAVRHSNNQPAVIHHRVGEGQVVLVTISPDRRWSDWPIRQTFLPFVDVTLGHLLGSASRQHNLVAGDELNWRLQPGDAGKAFELVTPQNTSVRLGSPELSEGRPLLRSEGITRAGVYQLRPRSLDERGVGDRALPLAVTPDLRDVDDLSSLTDSELDERLGFHVWHLSAGGDVTGIVSGARQQREWTIWLLLSVILLALLETAFAWWCGRGW